MTLLKDCKLILRNKKVIIIGAGIAGLTAIDAGPTVLTMYNIFENLFNSCGHDINENLDFIKEEIIARHWWRDQSTLDLYSSFEKNFEEIKKFAGHKSALEFEKFKN